MVYESFLSFLTSATATRSWVTLVASPRHRSTVTTGCWVTTATTRSAPADDSSSSQREALLAAVRAQHAQIQAMIKATAMPHPTPGVAVMAVMVMVRLGVMAVVWVCAKIR